MVPDLLRLLVDFLTRDDAFGDEPVGQQLGDTLLRLDLRVHLRLRVGGLVGLVVAEAAVADQVDQHVVAELLAECEGEPHGAHAGLHVVGVDVHDRHVEALRQVRCPARRARVVGVGREADLVVRDDVHRAADLVAVERLQVERLRDDALAGERGVAVDHDRHGRVGVLVRVRALARRLRRARRALDDRIDVLEVARVGLQVDANRLAVVEVVGALRAVVVLDVAGAALRDRRHRLERRGALELGEDRVVRAAEVVRQHVQAAAVRHPDHDLLAAVRRREADQFVDHRHGHVEALDRELVLAEIGLVHEALERVDLDQPAQQPAALLVGQRLAERARLDLLAQPDALAVRGDVLDLVRDRAAVGLVQMRQRVGQRRAWHVHVQHLRRDLRLDLGRQAERLRVEPGIALGLGFERVQARREVAVAAVAADEHRRRVHRFEQLVARRRSARGVAARDGRRRCRCRGGRSRRGRRRAEVDAERARTRRRRSRSRPAGIPRSASGSARTRRPG